MCVCLLKGGKNPSDKCIIVLFIPESLAPSNKDIASFYIKSFYKVFWVPVGTGGCTHAVPVGAGGCTHAVPVGASGCTHTVPVGAGGCTHAVGPGLAWHKNKEQNKLY